VAKIKYNVKGVESGGDMAPVKPGLYKAKIVECTERESRAGNEMIEVVMEITEKGEFKGRKLWYYVITDDEAMAFRVREFLEATGIVDPKKPKTEQGTFDPEGTVGTEVQVRVRSGKDQDDNPRGEVARMLKLDPDDADDDEDDDGDGEDEADWDAMDLDELRQEVEDYEGDPDEVIKDAKAKSKAKKEAALREWLEENATEDDGEDGDDDEGDDDDGATDDDGDGDDEAPYTDWTNDELKEELTNREIELSGKFTKSKAVAALEEDDEEEGDEDDEGDDDEGEDYSSWEIQDLKDELKKRKLPTKGKKSVLVSRLEKDDESGDGDPF
jgi:hypothetical protein